MTVHQEIEQVVSEDSLLTSQERAACEQIAARETPPHSQRALALLALDEGGTQAQAGEQTGLSRGQVKYWVARFRNRRLGIFPDSLLSEADVETQEATVEPVAEIEKELEAVPKKAGSVEDKRKGKKAKKAKVKKGKKTKKAKKAKTKDKKGKKAKKTKEKTKKAKKAKKAKKTKK